MSTDNQTRTVEVYADVLCPWSYIGKRRLETALAGTEGRERLEIVWRSYELSPEEGRTPGRTAAEAMGDWWGEQGSARVELIHTLGRAEGVDIDLTLARPVNTFDAHRLRHLAADHGLADQVMERLLRAYLCEGGNVSDPEVLERVGVEAGLDAGQVRALLDGDAYAKDVRADERRAKERGVNGVPMLIIDGRPPVSGIQPPADLTRLLQDALRPASVAGD
ncbi:DsbA family oxidoreductase [Streptosporangium sp. NPDC020145]|uniref:DsbA family oxidoreductase n=1 Tax=Streptosporangium sp. NPDC020145 TaxID=3154694 RepID=UPI0034167C46